MKNENGQQDMDSREHHARLVMSREEPFF